MPGERQPHADRDAGDTRAGIIFDLDGTLLDTLDDITASVNEVLADADLPPVTPRRMRTLIGEGLHVLLQRAAATQDQDLVSRLVQRYRPVYRRRMLDRTRVYDGVRHVLDELAGQGRAMCVLSNKPHEFTAHISAALLSPWPFVMCLGHREGTARKPEPSVALSLAERMRRPPGQVFMVGDSAIDIETGRNAGMQTVGVTWGFRDRAELHRAGATHIVDTPGRLLSVLHA